MRTPQKGDRVTWADWEGENKGRGTITGVDGSIAYLHDPSVPLPHPTDDGYPPGANGSFIWRFERHNHAGEVFLDGYNQLHDWGQRGQA